MATYYIGPSGDDTTGDGSQGNPWKNLITAVNATIKDDTIIVLQGTNVMDITHNIGVLGGITIKGETNDPRDTIIDFNNNYLYFEAQTLRHDIIENLTLYRSKNTVRRNETIGTNAAKGSSMTFNNVIFKEIVTGADRDYRSVEGGFISTNHNYTDVVFNFNACIFRDLYAYRFDSNYINLNLFTGRHDMTYNLTNCIIHRSNKPVPVDYSSRFTVFNGNSPQNVKNCIIKDDSGLSNSFYYSTYSVPTTTLETSNSCFHNIDIAFSSTTYTLPTDTNIETDPLFIDPDNEDYRLSSSSPCINSGVLF